MQTAVEHDGQIRAYAGETAAVTNDSTVDGRESATGGATLDDVLVELVFVYTPGHWVVPDGEVLDRLVHLVAVGAYHPRGLVDVLTEIETRAVRSNRAMMSLNLEAGFRVVGPPDPNQQSAAREPDR
jgi:hypothetical protein